MESSSKCFSFILKFATARTTFINFVQNEAYNIMKQLTQWIEDSSKCFPQSL